MAATLGEIRLVGFNFAPVGWAFCDGRLLSTADYPELFNLLGTTYGGNGATTFALPDLRGRAPICQGQGQALTARSVGSWAGSEKVVLTVSQLPAHNHTATASCYTGAGTTRSPVGAVPAGTPKRAYRINNHYQRMRAESVDVDTTGKGGSHNNMSPYVAINYIISLFGDVPGQG